MRRMIMLVACCMLMSGVAVSASDVGISASNVGKSMNRGGSGEVESIQRLDVTPPLPENAGQAAMAASCYDAPWLFGSHKWKWKWYFFTSWNSLEGTSRTEYGTWSAPCGIPLIANWLRVKGNNIGATFNAVIDKTAYNTSSVTANDKVNASGNNAANVCGARVTHTANAMGYQWGFDTVSGCY